MENTRSTYTKATPVEVVRPINNVIGYDFKKKKIKKEYSKPVEPKSNGTLTKAGKRLPRKADPLTSYKQIEAFKNYFLTGNQKYKYRNYALFMLGINVGLRISDLVSLRVGDLLPYGMDYGFVEYVWIKQEKTEKMVEIIINKDAQEAISLYLNTLSGYSLEDPLFSSRKRDSSGNLKHIDPKSVWEILNGASVDLGIEKEIHVGTHTLRKTFGSMVYHSAPNNTSGACMIMEALGHLRESTSLKYIGEVRKDLKDTVKNFDWKSR